MPEDQTRARSSRTESEVSVPPSIEIRSESSVGQLCGFRVRNFEAAAPGCVAESNTAVGSARSDALEIGTVSLCSRFRRSTLALNWEIIQLANNCSVHNATGSFVACHLILRRRIAPATVTPPCPSFASLVSSTSMLVFPCRNQFLHNVIRVG